MSAEQIKLSRRFVSGFMYETDATFNTNRLKLPLSVMVGTDHEMRQPRFGLRFLGSTSILKLKVADQKVGALYTA
jgi:hypothetical protein